MGSIVVKVVLVVDSFWPGVLKFRARGDECSLDAREDKVFWVEVMVKYVALESAVVEELATLAVDGSITVTASVLDLG